MSGTNWREELRRYIAQEARPVEKYGHQPRLYRLAGEIAEGLEYDDDVLFAAAWLHDLGVFQGHRPEEPEALARWDNVRYALEKTPELLAAMRFPAEKVDQVLEAIQTHQAAAEPESLEGTILRDADILEQLGAVGILRAVCKVGRDTRYPRFTEAVEVLRQASEKLPGALRLAKSRELAVGRVHVLRTFLEGLQREAPADLF